MRLMENYQMKAFRDFLDSCCLMDLESKGCAYTWANNREGDAYVKKRLDRAVCSMEWRVAFTEVEVYAFSAIGSDHSPLLISLSLGHAKRRKEFKFEDFWLEEAEYGEIVRDAWLKAEDTNQNLLIKLKRVSGELEVWSKSKFTNAHKRIKSLKKEIQKLTNHPSGGQDRERVQSLKEEIEKLWR
ncbi:uncharacterized protein LOC130140666 [Syzygium oleosum]|uniref:uncharacterized protein LOC130140666 n=1 Tax=Syzygium oleosum TaxID=219896 RepID=UPI0024B9CE9C|nr:uncharacterized protein LOC130140666 [Syzygium oleosum]